jgi:chromatin remodeling complex protein RSC6
VVGAGPLPRGEAVGEVWTCIRRRGPRYPEDRREIVADDRLEAVFGAKRVTMLEMNKHLARHLA